MFSKILVAIDGSDQSDRAIDVAADVALKYGADVVALCVYRHHSPLESSLSMVRTKTKSGDTPDQALKSYATELATHAKKRLQDAGVKNAEASAKRGQPARSIVEFAEQRNCDLIVLGARGDGDSGGFLMGSVSHKVTGLSKVCCLVVK